MSGRVLVSDSAGGHWRVLPSGTGEALTALSQLADGRVLLVGNGGVVAISDPKVERFAVTQRQDRQNLTALLPGSAGQALLFGGAGVLGPWPGEGAGGADMQRQTAVIAGQAAPFSGQ